LLIVVVLAALAMGGWLLMQRSGHCLARSRDYRALSAQNLRFARDVEAIADYYRKDLALSRTNPDHVLTVELMRTPRDAEDRIRLLEGGVGNSLRKMEAYRALSVRQREASEDFLRVAFRPWLPLPLPDTLPPPD
jgi:hypothetical protein